MKKMQETAPDSRVQAVSFPWWSLLCGLAALAYLGLMTEPALLAQWSLPATWLRTEIKYFLLAAFVLLALRDLLRYHRQRRRQHADFVRLRREIAELWQSKKQLQLKAHTYSGHAEKLKLFISDKLLDYIEYDEKFLHFKSIAAEVRHNGVISFDKVQTALTQAAAALTRGDAAGFDIRQIEAALDAMRYLWDMLDLSTADNLALHIGNSLCECEEHYYQRMLNAGAADPLPYEPVYNPRHAALRALAMVAGEDFPDVASTDVMEFGNARWYVCLAPVHELLGNENHLVMLLENLLKNALFFSGKRGYKTAFAPVALTLREEAGQVCISVYNRGPAIPQEDMPSLFQLGFSTRRTREHHGRGLGLYFVNEIVKGYEGRIAVHNIVTREARYTVRLELDSGDVITDLVEVVVINGQPRCRQATGEDVESIEWRCESRLQSVEVTTTDGPQGREQTQRLVDFAARGKQNRFDPARPERPLWRLVYTPKGREHRVTFEPMDIGGVVFDIHLPTAQQRLDSSEQAPDEDLDAQVRQLDQYFKSPLDDE